METLATIRRLSMSRSFRLRAAVARLSLFFALATRTGVEVGGAGDVRQSRRDCSLDSERLQTSAGKLHLMRREGVSGLIRARRSLKTQRDTSAWINHKDQLVFALDIDIFCWLHRLIEWTSRRQGLRGNGNAATRTGPLRAVRHGGLQQVHERSECLAVDVHVEFPA